jgi:uncharacterized protein YecE (DUF72 family)
MATNSSGKTWIGTSGWHYASWKGPFYPKGTPPEEMLAFLAAHFNSVEVNSTFYHLIERDVLKRWRNSVPSDFIFACKGSRFLTHMLKLKNPAKGLKRFFGRVEALEGKLGPVLFQLPPRWRVNVERLDRFIARLPSSGRFAFEFRDRSWLVDDVYDVLRSRKVALCLYDLGGYESPDVLTTNFVYVRLHGPHERYKGNYSTRAITRWARRIDDWKSDGLDVYCYFDNDQKAAALFDASKLKEKLDRS